MHKIRSRKKLRTYLVRQNVVKRSSVSGRKNERVHDLSLFGVDVAFEGGDQVLFLPHRRVRLRSGQFSEIRGPKRLIRVAHFRWMLSTIRNFEDRRRNVERSIEKSILKNIFEKFNFNNYSLITLKMTNKFKFS